MRNRRIFYRLLDCVHLYISNVIGVSDVKLDVSAYLLLFSVRRELNVDILAGESLI